MSVESEPKRRHELLRAAERLLRHYGVGKTTVADIAREAGVSVGAVYLEFSSKDDIVKALSGRCYAQVVELMQAALRGRGSFAERLTEFFDQRLEAFLGSCEGQHGHELVHGSCGVVRELHADFCATEENMVAELLRGGRRAGELEVPDETLTALALLRIYRSFEPPAIFDESASRLRQLLAATHVLVLNGLLRRP
jgi:AcrR family transcriptional regulator